MKELTLENRFIEKLLSISPKYKRSNIKNYEDLKQNLKEKIFLLNKDKLKKPLSDNEFKKIYNYLMNGNQIKKALKLRDKYLLERDNGEKVRIDFFKTSFSDKEVWCQNYFEIANQIEMEGKYKNRYDVTILINGLPLVQIELKRNGVDLKEAFNQIQRYQLESYQNTLFEYIQLFIISNKVNTKYFVNNKNLSYRFAFNWSDENNNNYHELFEFSEHFLKPCFLAKIIGEYIVISEVQEQMYVLRPYQYYAVKKIEEKVKLFQNQKGGYIWHTTGSGKTLTAFKTTQNIAQMPEIDKVLFVVDRKDLDIQTVKEYKKLDTDIEGVSSTKNLIKQFKGTKKLIITTIQKLNLAIKRNELKEFKNKKIVFIFDECHRNQFGKTNAEIKKYFKNSIMFGFTGTPIFVENEILKTTTADIFGNRLHQYTITDAIADGNVLQFKIEKFLDTKNKNKDIPYEDEKRIEEITKTIIQIHNKETRNKMFNALLAVANKEMAMKYYKSFKKIPHNLKIGLIFSYEANEDIDNINNINNTIDEKTSKEFLNNVIQDYNKMFNTNFNVNDFYAYYTDLQERIKNNEIDITIVVNMLLTGFDHKKLNTLYVDKNMKHHGLIQSFSRTNRILDDTKTHGNIITFRDLDEEIDEALKIFGNPEKNDIVLKKDYEEIKEEYEELTENLKELYPKASDILNIKSEEKKVEFVKLFRKILRLKTTLETYIEFEKKDSNISEEEFNNYISCYLELYNQKEKNFENDEKDSALNSVDFSIELIKDEIINYDYIIKLLKELDTSVEDFEEQKEKIIQALCKKIGFKAKKELIKEFIDSILPNIAKEEIEKELEKFLKNKKYEDMKNLAIEYNLNLEKLKKVIQTLEFKNDISEKYIIDMCNQKPTLLQRNKTAGLLKKVLKDFIDTYQLDF